MQADRIATSIAQKQLDHIANHMGWVVMRTGCSPAFTESHDFSCFIADRRGRVVSQADGIPIHTGGCGAAVRKVIEEWGPDIAQGDVFILSDPYVAGGNHLPDWTVIRPVHMDGVLAGFACCRGHQSDIGGGAAGTYNSEAEEIFHEGIRLPVLRLVEKGEVRRDLWNLLLLNSRCPDIVGGDVQAMLGATTVGAKRFLAMCSALGSDAADATMDAILDHGEAMMRAAIRSLPPGTYGATEISVTDCFEDRDVPVTVALTVVADTLTVDFTGSSPQVRGFKNSSLANTQSAVAMAIMTFFETDIPRNEGAQRPLKIVAPEGSIVNALAPAALTMCTIFPAHDIISACWKALAQAHPPGTLAGWGRINHCITTHRRADGSNVVIGHMNAHPGAGATPLRDGFNTIGQLPTLGGLILPNVEAFEQRVPLTVIRHEFRTDGGGAGKFRGGTGIDYEAIVESGAEYAFRSEGNGVPSGFGMQGGLHGAAGSLSLRTLQGEDVTVPRYCVRKFGPMHLRILSAGGGGFGDPRERDPRLVLRDVEDGVVSPAAARDVYGVDIASSDLGRKK